MIDLKALAADLFGVELTSEQVAAFDTYTRELLDWNQRMNLTAITDPEQIAVRHHLDSLSVAKVMSFDPGDRIIDVGTGAGFPGLPLHIAFPGIKTTLLDSTGKKLKFLEHVASTLNLQNVFTVHARAEDAGHISHHRAAYDVVLARAVALLPVLAEYLLPLAKVGGFCIAMKGESAEREAEEAAYAISLLGGELRDVVPIELPGVEGKHHLIVIEKIEKTPKGFPRKAGIPTRDPLI